MSVGIDRTTWLTLSRLLDEALDLPAEQRLQWLDSLDSAHAELKEKLRRLLSHPVSVATDQFLSALPKIDYGADPLQSGQADAIVGPYRLIRELGSGGMASVWLAERRDGLLNRPVALKLPHRAWRSAKLGERMAREREILASLNHPNIATLYDAGVTDDDQPYLALEYVQGEPIDSYCRTRSLSVRARLSLFLQVTNAVAHAHGKLIVHRDLKPSNILVTPAGEVRLLDFGIAKLLEDSASTIGSLTEQSGRAMTPDYAAPEQILGEPLTVAADIYSLGVVLYELLTATRPYRLLRNSRGALEDAILEAPPGKPSEVAAAVDRKALRGDLDTIALKALKKDPRDRYLTVYAFADDIVRHLRRRPVLAQPDNWRYLAGKFIARNKLMATAATTVLLAVFVGGGVALWEAHTANVEKLRAEEVQRFLTSVLQNADPYVAATQPHTVEEWLVETSHAVEKRTDLRPELRVEALTILGTGLLNSQKTAAAEEVLARAVAQAQSQLSRDDPLALHARVAFATLLRFRGRTRLLRQQLDELIPQLRAQPRAYPEDLVVAFKNRAHLEMEDGHYAEGEAAAREELELAKRRLPPDHSEIVTARMMLALAVQKSRDPQSALQITEQAYRATLARYHNDQRHPRVIEAERLYGFALGNAGQLPAALSHIRTAIDNASAVFGSNSRISGLYTVDLARVELKHGDLDQALAHSRLAVDKVALHVDQKSFRYADALAVRGNALLAKGFTQAALDDLRAATKILQDTVGPENPLTKAVANNLAMAQQTH